MWRTRCLTGTAKQQVINWAAATHQVDDVRSVMVDNIDKVLDRGDRIDHLVDKTKTMKSQVRQACYRYFRLVFMKAFSISRGSCLQNTTAHAETSPC